MAYAHELVVGKSYIGNYFDGTKEPLGNLLAKRIYIMKRADPEDYFSSSGDAVIPDAQPVEEINEVTASQIVKGYLPADMF
jgi:hypothetical protein